jgi:MoaA/NifB/PqqE/SkfB family radical SAM enzyme
MKRKIMPFLASVLVTILIGSRFFRKTASWFGKKLYSRYPYQKGKLMRYIFESVDEDAPWIQRTIELSQELGSAKRRHYIKTAVDVINTGTLKREDVQRKLGFRFPGLFIISPSNTCNLNCPVCYSLNSRDTRTMELDNLNKILNTYNPYGVNHVLMTGGEPLLYEGLFPVIESHPNMMFYIYTNGTLIDENITKRIGQFPNAFPMISTDISRNLLDSVRGCGIFDKTQYAENILAKERILYGKSIILTPNNINTLKQPEIYQSLFPGTCLAIMFVRYSGNDSNFQISNSEYIEFTKCISSLRKKIKGIVFNFPDEEFVYFGKCIKAEYLIHICPNGDVESCPFAHEKIGNVFTEDLVSILRRTHTESPCLIDCGNCKKECVSKTDD